MITYQMLPEVEQESYVPRVLISGWVRVPAAGPVFDCHGDGALRATIRIV